ELKRAAEGVRRGRSMVLFPEGTRGDGRFLLPFKKGGFYLAKASGVPIVPVGIRGSARILPRRGFLVRSGIIDVRIGAPILPDTIEAASSPDLIERVRKEVSELSGVALHDGT